LSFTPVPRFLQGVKGEGSADDGIIRPWVLLGWGNKPCNLDEWVLSACRTCWSSPVVDVYGIKKRAFHETRDGSFTPVPTRRWNVYENYKELIAREDNRLP